MSTNRNFDRIAEAWLAEGPSELADRVLDAALDEVHLTNQRRALRVPWRFSYMPALTRATGLAAVALVAVVGAGTLFYLTSNRPGGPGSQGTPAPTTAPTTAPTAALTPQPTFDPTAWTTYTSEVYGYTMRYPSDWSLRERATEKGQADIFTNPEEVDGEEIALFVAQLPAPEGADLATWEGLEAVVLDICGEPPVLACPSAPPTPMCLGQQECQPAIIVLVSDELTPSAFFGDPETGVVTVFEMGRPDDFPAAARYGGTMALLKAIVAQVDVREPEPGETPH